MAVRQIGLCRRSVAGRVPMDRGHHSVLVESSLERDFVLLQRFDPDVAGVDEQPVRIQYRASGGQRRSYVPDFLVRYRSHDRQPALVEVKYSNDPAYVDGRLEERFDAAKHYADGHGWSFTVATEATIRTPRLANAKFLLPFRNRRVDPGHSARLLQCQGECGHISAGELLQAAFPSSDDHPAVPPALWRLVASFRLRADLDAPLTMETVLTLGSLSHA